ncbi:glycosyl transferase family group 2-domain-containing protein [Gymnopilus junonius]|uniref:Glycosyl transferase family group 2-domain-containing protein n=1 Tax=Gymnopilus junonius TaxID=109634 RepID=A0A9P5NXT3_GYMJU|nr:glycosyl transferase family group 2-domain-containing protein [Gymnopilus junonius]
MDYDRNDALLHWLFRQTQGDAWFRPNEENISSGVALRVSDGPPEFRVFPYENASLEPFETAVAALNPVVAVKVRSAAVHAALAEVGPEEKSIYVDSETRIQILDTLLKLPQADREQCAAFIRDERVMVIWSESLDRIVPLCQDFEERLIKLLWRSRPTQPSSSYHGTGTSASAAGSVNDHSSAEALGPNGSNTNGSLGGRAPGSRPPSMFRGATGSIVKGLYGEQGREYDPEDPVRITPTENGSGEKELKDSAEGSEGSRVHSQRYKRTWYGKKVLVPDVRGVEDLESFGGEQRRPIRLYAPLYSGLAAGLSLFFVGNGFKQLLMEFWLDHEFVRFALVAVIPLLYCVSLFFALQIVQNITMIVGPIAHYHKNSKYYSANRPPPNKEVDNNLPHITIQMPVYKESLETVLAPSIRSLKKAMQTYARQGGTSTIFINDDGLRLLSPAERDERLAFYANHNIGWVARPKHDPSPDGFKRAGRFKKASNMNYGLALSLKMEKHLEVLLANATQANNVLRSSLSTTAHDSPHLGGDISGTGKENTSYGIQYQNRDGDESVVWGQGLGDEDLEEKALGLAIEDIWEESGRKWRPWAANGRSIRIGEFVLLVDSDTVVPEDCLRDAAREMKACPTVAIIQHESDVMQVAHHYFENGIAYFTRRINKCISFACANGEVAPFMGHNAFLRWRAIQDAVFVDPADGKEKVWSETNVSEDFDMALRLILKGYIIRWANYSKGAFKEGVSLSVDDELNRWQKYSYGCNELLFNPLIQWWRKGPINRQIHKFLWSSAPFHYKISMMAYGIAGSITISMINYVLLGFQFPVDGFFMHSFEIFLATTVVFWGSGTVGFTLLEYRLGHKKLFYALLENLLWIPFFFFFFGGLSIPVTQAILAHLFSYNIQWSATIKEVERSNFFKEIPKIAKRFWFPMLFSVLIMAGMIIVSTPLVPFEWRVDGSAWAVILPLSIAVACHILFPIVLNPWLMVFSY